MDLKDFPIYPQRQDSLNDQLRDLQAVANRIGCYDAADFIRQTFDRADPPKLAYGCRVDLDPDDEPDECVLDKGRPQDCMFTRDLNPKVMRKEQCKYWRPK